MTPKTKTRLTLTLGIAVAATFLFLALRDTDPAQIMAGLAQSDLRYIPVVAAALMIQFWFKAARWRMLLSPFAKTRTSQVMRATVVGYLANLVFPLYIGEIARAYILGRQLNLRYTPVLATMVLERLFDFLSVMFFVGLVLTFDPRVPQNLKTVGISAGLASLALVAMLVIYLRWTDGITRAVVKLSSLASDSLGHRIAEHIELGKLGLAAVRDPRKLPGIALTSLLQWGAMGVCIYAGMIGTGVEAPVSASFVVLALTVMAVTLPSSPGFFGTIQFCFTLGLAAYGVSASDAFAASVFFHLTIYATGWVTGLYFLHGIGMSLGRLREVSIEEGGSRLGDTDRISTQ